jgi:hypothetical protein
MKKKLFCIVDEEKTQHNEELKYLTINSNYLVSFRSGLQ